MDNINRLIVSVSILLAFSIVLPQPVHSTTIAPEANVLITGTNDLVVVSTSAYEFSFSKSSLQWDATKRGSIESFLKCAGWKLFYNATSAQADDDAYNSTNGGHYWSNSSFEGGVFLNFTAFSNLIAPTVMEYFWFYSEYFVIQINVTQTIPAAAISVERVRYFDDVASRLKVGSQPNMNFVSWKFGERYQAQDVVDLEPPMFIFSNMTDEGLVTAPMRPDWTHRARAYMSESDFKFLYELQTDTLNADNVTISEKNHVSFDKVFFQFTSSDINRAFVEYALLYSSMYKLRPYKGSQRYWLTWYAGNGGERGTNLTETDVISNATWIAENLDSYYGFDGVLLDAIICDEVGDWLNYSRTRFPSGMSAIVEKIHAMGLKVGLWVAPLLVEKDGWINRTHPEAIAADKTGQPVRTQMYFGQVEHDLYFLNPFNSWVQDRLRWVNENISQWGFDFVKMDFLSGALSGLFQENKTRYMVMQQALKSITAGLDERIVVTAHAAASYSPSLMVSYVDRVWLYGPDLWVYSEEQQLQWGSLTQKYDAVANLIPFIKHFNLTVDADALGRLSTDPPIPKSFSKFYSTYATVGGGTFEIGEKLSSIDDDTLAFYRKHLPYVSAKWSPVEWDSISRARPPRIWIYNNQTAEEKHYYVAVFNTENASRTVRIDLQNQLKLPDGTYLAMDQYSSQFLGEHSDEIDISLGAYDTAILTLTWKTTSPTFLMRSDHVTASSAFVSSLFGEGKLTLLLHGNPETWTGIAVYSQQELAYVVSGDTELVRFNVNSDFEASEKAGWYYDSSSKILYIKVWENSPVRVIAGLVYDSSYFAWRFERFIAGAREQLVEVLGSSGNQTTAPTYDPGVKPSDIEQPEIPAFLGLIAIAFAVLGTLLAIYLKNRPRRKDPDHISNANVLMKTTSSLGITGASTSSGRGLRSVIEQHLSALRNDPLRLLTTVYLVLVWMVARSHVSDNNNLPMILFILPTVILVPLLFGTLLLRAILRKRKKGLVVLGPLSFSIIAWITGLLTIFATASILFEFGVLQSSIYSSTILVICIATSLFIRNPDFGSSQFTATLTAIFGDKRMILVVILAGLLPLLYVIPRSPFPSSINATYIWYLNALEFRDISYVELVGGNAPLLSTLYGVLSTAYETHPLSLLSGTSYLGHILYPMFIYVLTYKLTKRIDISLIASFIAPWVYEGITLMVLEERSLNFMIFPLLLYLAYDYLEKWLVKPKRFSLKSQALLLPLAVSPLFVLLSSGPSAPQILRFSLLVLYPILIVGFAYFVQNEEHKAFLLSLILPLIGIGVIHAVELLFIFTFLSFFAISVILTAENRLTVVKVLGLSFFALAHVVVASIIPLPFSDNFMLTRWRFGSLFDGVNPIDLNPTQRYEILASLGPQLIFALFMISLPIIMLLTKRKGERNGIVPFAFMCAFVVFVTFIPDGLIGWRASMYWNISYAIMCPAFVFLLIDGLAEKIKKISLISLLGRKINLVKALGFLLLMLLLLPFFLSPRINYLNNFAKTNPEGYLSYIQPYETNAAFWIYGNTNSSAILVSDPHTMLILKCLTMRDTLLKEYIYIFDKEYSSATRSAMILLRQNVFMSVTPQQSYDELLDALGNDSEGREILVVVSPRTLTWIKTGEMFPVNIEKTDAQQISDLPFEGERFSPIFSDAKNELHIYRLV